jgi:hypothetical protein
MLVKNNKSFKKCWFPGIVYFSLGHSSPTFTRPPLSLVTSYFFPKQPQALMPTETAVETSSADLSFEIQTFVRVALLENSIVRI